MVHFIYLKQRLQPEEPGRAHISGTKLSGFLGGLCDTPKGKTAVKFIPNLTQFTHD